MTLTLREASVRTDHAVPRELFLCRGEDAADKPRGPWVDIAVRADATLGNHPDPLDDPGFAGCCILDDLDHVRD